MRVRVSRGVQYLVALGVATVVSVGLFTAESLLYHHLADVYLLWNLFLAWVPLGLALWLQDVVRRKQWSSWEGLMASAAWTLFLPNSFYMISDFIHLAEVPSDELLFNVVTFTSFISLGVLLGFTSLYVVHAELKKRLGPVASGMMVGVILLVCSIAIYIGRDLRWNSWDVLLSPAGVLFDVSERLVHPDQYGQVLVVVLPFFVLLGSMYLVFWRGVYLLKAK